MKTDKSIHFITGGTGFMESNLILKLLTQTDTELYCLVHPTSEDAEMRLHRILMEAATAG